MLYKHYTIFGQTTQNCPACCFVIVYLELMTTVWIRSEQLNHEKQRKNNDLVQPTHITHISLSQHFPQSRGVLPTVGYRVTLRLNGVPLFRFLVYARVGISIVELYQRVGKSVISVCEKTQKRKTLIDKLCYLVIFKRKQEPIFKGISETMK